jgi:hypothetical protein
MRQQGYDELLMQTLRLQVRDVLAYLMEALTTDRAGLPASKLLLTI